MWMDFGAITGINSEPRFGNSPPIFMKRRTYFVRTCLFQFGIVKFQLQRECRSQVESGGRVGQIRSEEWPGKIRTSQEDSPGCR